MSYTKGELFFPADIERYLHCCSLWLDLPGGKEQEVVAAGELTVERLAQAERGWPGQYQHLRFVQEASLRAEARRFRRTARPVIPKSGRLAAVGVFGRIVDVLMKLSLLIRGAVPGGVAAAAATRYRDRLDTGGATYYGRVLREGGYIVLQYWFFYAMNDWRSTYGGVNDHEADWEKVVVYLAETPDGGVEPVWVGASSHEYVGDDLRRGWEDPELRREGDHPVVFVGAGSHSHQMLPGDYLIQVDPAFLRGPLRLWRRMITRLLSSNSAIVRHGIGIPFVDYARGDGVRVGPGGDREWTPVLIDDETPWVRGFRGLWGRDTGDWFDGERAPSGPRYERDGTIRRSWADPLAWVGLHKVAPTTTAARGELLAHLGDLADRIDAADADIVRGRDELRRLSSAATVLKRRAHTEARARDYADRIVKAEAKLTGLYRERALLLDERDVHRSALERGESLVLGATEHLRAPHLPYASGEQRPTRFLHVWAALSTPLLIIGLGAIVLLLGGALALPASIGLVLLFAVFDAFARRRLASFLTGLAVIALVLGVITAVIVAFTLNWRITILVPMALVVVSLLVVNVRDLLRR
ncbi:multisubunit Na+/H+ antiporter MnhG subunit [Spinactinospora alkalitolerans]|uniref:Multisubunit Na+/H+ antiporter MnhG subunit n=1 Tax=Spinactinospora alkalitolerans TaxID=687207 RepID=A0A852TX06_9ACTN|nr:multisubunit Na+/H+ antiporter MnhG subunit [Spinactinospora alkalitolerans]